MIKLYHFLFEEKEKPEPDQPDGGVLGKYVFGSIRKDIGQNINEPDTELEKEIYKALLFYTSFNSKELLNGVADEMYKISKSGKYAEYFTVPSATVWRLLIDVSKSDLKKIIGKEVESDIGIEDSGIVSPRGDAKFTGWTLDPKATIRLYNQARIEAVKPTASSRSSKTDEEEDDNMPYMPPEYLSKPLKEEKDKKEEEKYIVLVKCNTSGNSFFFNVDAVLKYLSIGGSSYAYQKEVLAYGDVTASGVAYKNMKKVSGNPVPELIALLG